MTDSAKMDDASIRGRLIALIDDLDTKQCLRLLEMMDNWQDRPLRKHSRESCRLSVDCETPDGLSSEVLGNISDGGAFIRTQTPFSIGQALEMTFAVSKGRKPVKIKGEIVWTGALGIGVKFSEPHKDLNLLIQSL